MKNKMIFGISGVALTAGVLAVVAMAGCKREKITNPVTTQSATAEAFTWEYIPGQYIVAYEKAAIGNPQQKIGKNPIALEQYINTVTDAIMEEIGIADDVEVQRIYANSINGFSAKLSDEALEALKRDKRVAYIEQDMIITLGKPGGGGGTPAAQVIPYGVQRVNWAQYSGENVAWILDTGIDLDHKDLNVNRSRGFNAMTTGKDARTLDDLNGHGSHVAGIVAAIDNTIGVVGVAAGATVIPVKVLGQTGSGSYSGIIAGVDYVAANGAPGDVANMSLGGGAFALLDNAVIAAAANGISFCLASGNSATDAGNSSPARANGPNVYTISAMNSSDIWANFSNFGSVVDYCAPGVSIYSTYKDGGYTTMSGTSMAAPHAAGVLLLGSIATDGFVINDPDGNADPIIVH